MGFLMKFFTNFVLIWLLAAIAFVIAFGGWHFITKQNLEYFREDAFLFGLVFMPTVAALVMGLARAFGWKG